MGVEQAAPDFVQGLTDGLRELGAHLRTMKQDLIVLTSVHWIYTFNWYVAAQKTHSGICVADEAPDLMPGTPHERAGDPTYANSLTVNIGDIGLPCRTNATPDFLWDNASLVPLLYLDPNTEIPVVLLPTCLAADLDECEDVGIAVSKTARATGRKVIVIKSFALSHAVVRGPELWPTEPRVALDRKFMELVDRGRLKELVAE